MDNDAMWEFNCPQFVDFLEDSLENDGADAFFDQETRTRTFRYYQERRTMVEEGSSTMRRAASESTASESSHDGVFVLRGRLECAKSNGLPVKRPFHPEGWPTLPPNAANSPLAKRQRFSGAEATKARPSTSSFRHRLGNYRKVAANNYCKTKPMTTRPDNGKEFDFAASLRHYDPPEPCPKGVSRTTSPSPFKLTETKIKNRVEEYKTMAQEIIEFQTKTPARFRTKKPENRRRSKSNDDSVSSFAKAVHAIREACSPKLLTKLRHRPVTCLSQKEIEEKELEEMKKFQFHARPVNKAIFEKGGVAMQNVMKKPNTIVQPFNLHDGNLKPRVDEVEEKVTLFHARPVPKGIFDKPLGLPEPIKRLPTIPMSPKFLLKPNPKRNKENVNDQLDSRSSCSLNSTASSMRWDPKPTIMAPFTFEARDIDRLAKKKLMVQKVLEEEKRLREFHANPMPNLDPAGIPKKKMKSPTKLQPFCIVDEVKPMKTAKEWEEEVQEELREQRLTASFRAKACNVIYAKPFVPQKSQRPLTEPKCLDLKTEERYYERQKFQEYLEEKEARLEEMLRQQRREIESREQRLLQEQRAATVHAAQPIRRYKPLPEIKILPPTEAQSPGFQTSERLRSFK